MSYEPAESEREKKTKISAGMTEVERAGLTEVSVQDAGSARLCMSRSAGFLKSKTQSGCEVYLESP